MEHFIDGLASGFVSEFLGKLYKMNMPGLHPKIKISGNLEIASNCLQSYNTGDSDVQPGFKIIKNPTQRLFSC